MRLLTIGLLAWMVSSSAFAETSSYFQIANVTVHEVVDTEPGVGLFVSDDGELDFAGDPSEIAIDEIMNYGKKIWQVIQENKPVVNTKFDHANALPEGAVHWARLGYWQPPKSRVFQVTYKNGLGMNVVDFTFRVIYTWGGRLNGKGRYLANASIVPVNLVVAWGFTFNANAEVSSTFNVGSPEDPIAAMQLDLHWRVNTPVKHAESTENFYVCGDGTFQRI